MDGYHAEDIGEEVVIICRTISLFIPSRQFHYLEGDLIGEGVEGRHGGGGGGHRDSWRWRALQFWFGSLLFYFVNVVKMTSLQFAALLYSPVLLRFCTGWCTDV